MFKVSKFSKSVVLSAMTALVLAGCSGGEEASTQEELNLSNDTAVAFVTKSAASESQANLAQFEQTFQSKTRFPLAASSPYRVNFGSKLNMKTSLDIDSRNYSAILDEYFGTSDYDVKDLNTSADGKTLIFAAHGPETSATDNSWNIYRMDFDTMTVSRIIKDDVIANSGQDTGPTFAADSKTIIFTTDRAAGNPNSPVVNVIDDELEENCYKVEPNEKPSLLHSMKLDGSNILQLTYGDNHDISPVTMNDGRISFIRVWQSFTSVRQQCGASIQKSSDGFQSNSDGLLGSANAQGLDKPDGWSDNAICQFATETPVGPVVANNHYTILRITPDGSTMEQLYNTVTVTNSDESFLHLTDLTQAENGKLVAILKHQYNQFLGGIPVELQSPLNGDSSQVFGNFSPESIVDGDLSVYPNQLSEGGLFSSLETYRDGSGRKLLSWSKCTTINDRNISSFCDADSSVEDLDNRYALWVLDEGEMLPITRSQQDVVYTDVTISQPHENAEFPFQAFNPDYTDNLDDSRIVCVAPPTGGEPTPTPTPAPTRPPVPTVTPAPTQPPVPTVVPVPTRPPAPTVTPAPTRPPLPTVTPAPTRPPVPTVTPAPTRPPAPTVTPAPTRPPVPTVTPAPTRPPVPTVTPAPTRPPVPTVTPAPTRPPVPTVTPAPTRPPVPTVTPVPTQTPEPTEPPEPINKAPIADAGPDVTTGVGAIEMLDGSSSSDPDGDELSFKWTVSGGGEGLVLTMAESKTPVVTATERGTYIVSLVVNDGKVDSAPDTVQVIVENTPPVADAGADQAGAVGEVLTLDGSNSGDADGDAITYAWSIVGDDEGIALRGETSKTPRLAVLANGTYQVQLIVNDGEADSAPDIMMVDAANGRPVADAGADQKAEKDTNVVLDGTRSSDPDGDTLSYDWTFIETPEGVEIDFDNSTSDTPTFVPAAVGTYVAQLIVNDGSLSSDPDTVTVTVLKTPDEVIFDCDSLPHQTVQLPLNFPSTVRGDDEPRYPGRCTWDHAIVDGQSAQGENYDFIQGFNRQSVEPNLPANAVVCSSKISATAGSEVNWTYDDEFFITVGEQIIVASESAERMEPLADAASGLAYGQGQYFWNFDNYKWQRYGYFSDERYCLGHDRTGGIFADDNPSCQFPRTQLTGTFNIDIPAEAFAEVSANIVNEGKAEFSLIIGGDDDPAIDCQHSGIDLTWDVEYVVPPTQE